MGAGDDRRSSEHTVKPVLGARDALTPADLTTLVEKLAPFETWRAGKPATKLGALTAARVKDLAAPDLRGKVYDLINADAALTGEYEQIASVVRAVRFQRDLGRILRNFVNFSDFYSKRDGVFQAGTLYLDGRALHLCVPVTDAGKHGALAGSSDACLLYCDITREGEKKQIAAALTNGDADNVFVGATASSTIGRQGLGRDGRQGHQQPDQRPRGVLVAVQEALQGDRGHGHQARAGR